MKITTVKGTNDYLPREVAIRDYLQSVILRTYQSYGFERIMTPIIEDIENLDKSEGGENLNLIFKVLKRGDKLQKAIDSGDEKELTDMGLRYDLTLPLTRYYANNRAKLVSPFKVIQMDKVYRAERPQKGRLREFVQCDIDIIGTKSSNAEVELINTTANALMNIGINNFRIKINDRRLLKAILLKAGFEDNQLDSVCISFDKLDKIGAEGVKEELLSKEFGEDAIDNLMKVLEDAPFTLDKAKAYVGEDESIESLESIMSAVESISGGKYTVVYDMKLVRGQGYYTGTIFEVESPDFRGAIAGGGRYDNLIGKFINEDVPAVGFSIGFERIYGILLESDFKIPNQKKKIAVIYDADDIASALKIADSYREEYDVALYERIKKVGKLIDKLQNAGFDGFYICNQSEELKMFDE
ncbi:MAG: histidine--tRNA ligase [Lachnospiraceae bacterium]|nr:histidine--tRNA ligase [Lachnospiraceae bacterium]